MYKNNDDSIFIKFGLLKLRVSAVSNLVNSRNNINTAEKSVFGFLLNLLVRVSAVSNLANSLNKPTKTHKFVLSI